METVKVNFTYIDNSTVILVGGVQVWDSNSVPRAKFDTPVAVDITKFLAQGSNFVHVHGINKGPLSTENPFQFDYTITVGGVTVATIQQKSNASQDNTPKSYLAASSMIQILMPQDA